jgi:hypothetical protein
MIYQWANGQIFNIKIRKNLASGFESGKQAIFG